LIAAAGQAAAALAGAAAAGDEAAFAELARRHRRELHVHCYRMLASFDDAEDAVQDTFLRAWRGRAGFDCGGHYRAWLYRIATNVSLDLLRARARQARTAATFADLPWLQPYPDQLLDEVASEQAGPDDVVIGRETIELAFLAALQILAPRQRAAFLVRDVLGWPAADAAELLGSSVAAANSAVQRARALMREHLPSHRADWPSGQPAGDERRLLQEFIAAHERLDPDAMARLAAADIRVTMPPNPSCFQGLAAMAPLFARAFGPDRDGDWRLLPAAVNRMPAAGSYLRRPGDPVFRPFKLDVLRIEDGRIAEITTFGYAQFPALGLPPALPAA
jgi:RNA polymerase sigma-70 factor (TIGR02960 family)